jgi:hypothetical protein
MLAFWLNPNFDFEIFFPKMKISLEKITTAD